MEWRKASLNSCSCIFMRNSSLMDQSALGASRVGYGEAQEKDIYGRCSWISLLTGDNATFVWWEINRYINLISEDLQLCGGLTKVSFVEHLLFGGKHVGHCRVFTVASWGIAVSLDRARSSIFWNKRWTRKVNTWPSARTPKITLEGTCDNLWSEKFEFKSQPSCLPNAA